MVDVFIVLAIFLLFNLTVDAIIKLFIGEGKKGPEEAQLLVMSLLTSLVYLFTNSIILSLVGNLFGGIIYNKVTSNSGLAGLGPAILAMYSFFGLGYILLEGFFSYLNFDLLANSVAILALSLSIFTFVNFLIIVLLKILQLDGIKKYFLVSIYLLPIILILLRIYFLFEDRDLVSMNTAFYLLVLFFALSLVISLFALSFRNKEGAKAYKNLERTNMVNEKEISILAEERKEEAKFKHDLRNIAIGLVSKEDKEIRKNLEDYISWSGNGNIKRYSLNPTINFILNEKLGRIEIIDERLEINIDTGAKLNIDSVDLGVILGNLLDNSIKEISQQNLDERYLLRLNRLIWDYWLKFLTQKEELVRIGK